MFKLYKSEDENKFTWQSIGDLVEGRRNLGENMPVYVYCLFKFTIKDELAKRFGNEITVDIFRNAGMLAGEEFAIMMKVFWQESLRYIQKKEYMVTEVDCWATGSRVCRFEANIKNIGEINNE